MQKSHHNLFQFSIIHSHNIPAAELGYFFIYPFPASNQTTKPVSKVEPSLRTYRDQNQTLADILSQYQQRVKSLIHRKKLCLELADGRALSPALSLAVLTKILNLVNLNGLVLYVGQMDPYRKILDERSEQTERQFSNECGLQNFLMASRQDFRNGLTININFQLPSSELVISIASKTTDYMRKVVEDFYIQLALYFGIGREDLKNLRFYLELKDTGRTRVPLKLEGPVQEVEGLVNWSTVIVETSSLVHFKREVKHPDHKLIIYKENSTSSPVVMCFQAIECMFFRNLYLNTLAPNRSQGQSNNSCLQVLDILVHPHQSLSKLAPLFKGREKTVFSLVGRVVSQKMFFYKTMNNIRLKDSSFNLEDHICSGNRSQDRQVFQTELRTRIEKTAKRVGKDMSHVESIYIYTCQDVHPVDAEEGSGSQPVFNALNAYLRESSIFEKRESEIAAEWKFQYASLLLTQLETIQSQKDLVYRGVNYDPQVGRGDVLTFKPFTSTSIHRFVAEGFLSPHSLDQTLFIMKIISGKSIKKFSDYEGEEELLLEPYTQFRVTEVKTEEKEVLDSIITMRTVELEELSEVESSRHYPSSVGNVVIWVDREKEVSEPKTIFKAIEQFRHSTLLVELTSTEELQRWLLEQKTSAIFDDKESKIVLITNMVRQEKGVVNYQAGIEAIMTVQDMHPSRQVPAFLYVGDVDRARQTLQTRATNMRHSDRVQVGQLAEVKAFLSQHLEVSFGGEAKQAEQSKLEELSTINLTNCSGNKNCLLM